MEEIREMLNEEIQCEINGLKEIEIGSEPYKATVDGLSKLVDRTIEIKKIEAEAEQKIKQEVEEKKDRKWRNGIAIGGIIIPTIVTIWGTFKTLKFEETGSITTSAGRNFIGKLFGKK